VRARNHGGGHYNHSLFWKVMTGPTDSNGPSSALKAGIDEAFGSMEAFKDKFNAAATSRFGSGWAWLVVQDGGKLAVTSTPNQVRPRPPGTVGQPQSVGQSCGLQRETRH
jgi:Fe-Mn family superoxide dismutase